MRMNDVLWLVRKQNFEILGPYAEAQLLEMLKGGYFTPYDEVCPGLGYWFPLHDRSEVKKHFHLDEIPFRKMSQSDYETTWPGLASQEATETLKVDQAALESNNQSLSSAESKDLQPLPKRLGKKAPQLKPSANVHVPVEKGSLLQVIISVLIIVFILALGWVYYLLKKSS